jgi:hypothetical protein
MHASKLGGLTPNIRIKLNVSTQQLHRTSVEMNLVRGHRPAMTLGSRSSAEASLKAKDPDHINSLYNKIVGATLKELLYRPH